MEKIMRRLSSYLIFTVILTAGFSGAAFAQCSPGIPCTADDDFEIDTNATEFQVDPDERDSCDSDFMNQIYAKAFLEAEREVAVNQTIIKKPDSVMEYTCFDQFVSMTAHSGGAIFSDTNDWRLHTVDISTMFPWPPTIMATWMFDIFAGFGDKLDASLERVVLDGLEGYVDDNFGHDFLGGTAGIDSDISDDIGPDSITCDSMQQVWQIAKCDNFGSDVGFVSFEDLVGEDNDPRQWPEECEGTSITDAIIAVARNDDWTFAANDPVLTHLDLMLPPGGTVTCGDPIPTGVRITRYEWDPDLYGDTDRTADEYDDKVCPNPSCYYDYEGNTCNP